MTHRGHSAMSTDVFGCHKLEGAVSIWWAGAGGAAQHSATQRTAPQQGIIRLKMSIVWRLKESFVFNGIGYLSLNFGINLERYLWVVSSPRDSNECL